MSYGLPGCIKQHPRSGETHHLSHSFAHDGFVTMYGAFLACTLLLSKRTMVETCVGIAEQLFTVGTKNCIFFFFPAIEADHQLPFSFRAQCVMLSSFSFLHFGMTKIAKIMQKCRRILLKYTFFFFLFWKAPFHFGRVFRDYFFKMKKI